MERCPREKFQLATKNAAWLECRTREDAAAQFETSLRQTGAGYIDFYLLHNLGEGRTLGTDRVLSQNESAHPQNMRVLAVYDMLFPGERTFLPEMIRPETNPAQMQSVKSQTRGHKLQQRMNPEHNASPTSGGRMSRPPYNFDQKDTECTIRASTSSSEKGFMARSMTVFFTPP